MKIHEFSGIVVLSVGSCFCCGYCFCKKCYDAGYCRQVESESSEA